MSLFSIQPHHPGDVDPYAPVPLSVPTARELRRGGHRFARPPRVARTSA